MDVDISIVTGTLNRLPYLKTMLDSLYSEDLKRCAEIIIVDGGSTDGTAEWLDKQHDSLVVIQQGQALGAVKAFNAGFAVAQGKYVVNLNDDVILHPPCIGRAVDLLERYPQVGQIAIPFTMPGSVIKGGRHSGYPAATTQMVVLGGQHWLYANFGVTRRELGQQAGWWGDYTQYGGDTELSLKIWQMGYRVESMTGNGFIEHLEVQDQTRKWAPADSKKFFERWGQWTPWQRGHLSDSA